MDSHCVCRLEHSSGASAPLVPQFVAFSFLVQQKSVLRGGGKAPGAGIFRKISWVISAATRHLNVCCSRLFISKLAMLHFACSHHLVGFLLLMLLLKTGSDCWLHVWSNHPKSVTLENVLSKWSYWSICVCCLWYVIGWVVYLLHWWSMHFHRRTNTWRSCLLSSL